MAVSQCSVEGLPRPAANILSAWIIFRLRLWGWNRTILVCLGKILFLSLILKFLLKNLLW